MFFSLSDNILTKIAKYSVFFACLAIIIVVLLILSTEKSSEIKREFTTINIDISNQINICTPSQNEE